MISAMSFIFLIVTLPKLSAQLNIKPDNKELLMDRRKFLAWAGVSCVASSLPVAIGSLSLEPAARASALTKSKHRTTFYTKGRYLYDRLGNKVILRGVNKMSVWDGDDPTGSIYLPEIRKTGANSVRIVWAIRKDLQPGTPDTNPAQLNTLIANAKNNHLIPMIELHDG
jgi:mannan endo-1,4-beta-mannosidase